MVDVAVTTAVGTSTGTNLFTYTAPDITLEAPTGTAVTNGSGTLADGSIAPGQTRDLNVIVHNTGNGDLTSIAASIIGTDAGQFTLVSTPPATLAAGASAAFTIRFSPTSLGAKSATLSIASSDPNQNPFTLTLTSAGNPALVSAISAAKPPRTPGLLTPRSFPQALMEEHGPPPRAARRWNPSTASGSG